MVITGATDTEFFYSKSAHVKLSSVAQWHFFFDASVDTRVLRYDINYELIMQCLESNWLATIYLDALCEVEVFGHEI